MKVLAPVAVCLFYCTVHDGVRTESAEVCDCWSDDPDYACDRRQMFYDDRPCAFVTPDGGSVCVLKASHSGVHKVSRKASSSDEGQP